MKYYLGFQKISHSNSNIFAILPHHFSNFTIFWKYHISNHYWGNANLSKSHDIINMFLKCCWYLCFVWRAIHIDWSKSYVLVIYAFEGCLTKLYMSKITALVSFSPIPWIIHTRNILHRSTFLSSIITSTWYA